MVIFLVLDLWWRAQRKNIFFRVFIIKHQVLIKESYNVYIYKHIVMNYYKQEEDRDKQFEDQRRLI